MAIFGNEHRLVIVGAGFCGATIAYKVASELDLPVLVLDRRVLALGTPREVVESGAYSAIREHTHTHGHLRHDHEPHAAHAVHPEMRA